MEKENELFELYRFTADPGQAPLRVDKFLVDRIENTSRTKIQKAAEAGHLLVNEEAVKSNYKIKPGDTISITTREEPKHFAPIPQDIPLDIVYEDNTMLIVNKPAPMVVHPGFGNEQGTLVNALMFYLKDLPLFHCGKVKAGLVHRLDKNTTGLVTIAKTETALMHLTKQFAERIPQKTYRTLVWGIPKEPEGTITGHVGRNLKNRKVMHVFPEGDHGKEAVTHYKVLETFDYVSLLECQPKTGRTHQIRVHLKYLGHPVFGDFEYGGDEILRGTRYTKYKQFVHNCFKLMPHQALHAYQLELRHPETEEWISFQCSPPENFQLLLDKWKQYISGRKV